MNKYSYIISIHALPRHRPRVRRIPQLLGFLCHRTRTVGSPARLRPANGEPCDQRDGGQGCEVPSQVRSFVSGETGERTAEG